MVLVSVCSGTHWPLMTAALAAWMAIMLSAKIIIARTIFFM
jgi:hypothetical protein